MTRSINQKKTVMLLLSLFSCNIFLGSEQKSHTTANMSKQPEKTTSSSTGGQKTEQELLAEFDQIAITANPKTTLCVVGQSYASADLPAQDKTRGTLSGKWITEQSHKFIERLIQSGTYNEEYHDQNSGIAGRNTNALKELTEQSTTQKKKSHEDLTQLLQVQRSNQQDRNNAISLTLTAITSAAGKQTPKVDQSQLEATFHRLKQQESNDAAMFQTIAKEFYERRKASKGIRRQARDLHLTGDRTLPVSDDEAEDEKDFKKFIATSLGFKK